MVRNINLQLFADEGFAEVAGVETTPVAAEQETTTEVMTESSTESAGNETSEGVKQTQPAAEVDKVEKAFAARLQKERQKIEVEAKQRARDEWISEQGYEWNGKPIATEAEYKEALREKELVEQYQSKGLPEEAVQELVEGKKFREKYESDVKAKQAEEQQKADLKDFIAMFPDVKPEEIPIEVWKANAEGIPLRYAYSEHALKLTKAADMKVKANIENAQSSMGSVSTDGVNTVLTAEMVENMTPQQLTKRWGEVKKIFNMK